LNSPVIAAGIDVIGDDGNRKHEATLASECRWQTW
ncbi:unnamed protein product, partial [marine sediment metagenome]